MPITNELAHTQVGVFVSVCQSLLHQSVSINSSRGARQHDVLYNLVEMHTATTSASTTRLLPALMLLSAALQQAATPITCSFIIHAAFCLY